MEIFHPLINFVDFILHFDTHLDQILLQYGTWTYAILGGIVFCETGLVVTPILPGDSLLFAVGAFVARGSLEGATAFFILSAAAILGDAANYGIGYFVGPKALTTKSKWFRREYLDRTHGFFERYGGKTILLARFVPIIRTFAPFLAGIGRMSYWRFASYNVAGGFLWIALCLGSGYFFGNLPLVKKNFSLVVLGIVFVSLLPAVFEWARAKKGRSGTVAI